MKTKSEIRESKSERSPKSEIRNHGRDRADVFNRSGPFVAPLQISAFGFLSGLGLRASDFALALGLALLVCAFPAFAADTFTEKLQRGLFEEEANHNLDAAIKEYQSVVAQSDEQRKVIATALFRLGECYRKLGRTNEASAQYQRILRDFSEQEQLVTLIPRQAAPSGPGTVMPSWKTVSDPEQVRLLQEEIKLAEQQVTAEERSHASGRAPLAAVLNAKRDVLAVRRLLPENSSLPRQRSLLNEQIKIVEQSLNEANEMLKVGRASPTDVIPLRRELLTLQREMAGLTENSAASIAGAAIQTGLTSAEAEGLERIRALARNSPDLFNAPFEGGLTPIQWAAYHGYPTVLEFLLSQGLNVNEPERQTPPLVLAAEGGHLRIVDMLLNHGADVNAGGTSRRTALIAAVSKGFKALAELLLARGADVNRATAGNGTALHSAVAQGSSNAVALLLAQKANPNVLTRPERSGSPQPAQPMESRNYDDANGATPLHMAARRNDLDIAEMLLKAGATVNATNWGGATPLHIAVASERTNTLRLLLAHGADPNVRDLNGATPLALAVQRSADMTEALLAAGAKVNEPAYEQPNWVIYPLHLAAAQPKPDILRALLAEKPNLQVKNSEGYTPLWSALTANGTDTNVQMLIAAGANVHIPFNNQSPIQYAVQQKSETIVSLLLDAGVDSNQRDQFGNSLLHYAVSRTLGIVRRLLEQSANPNVLNKDGQTPLSLAASPNRATRPPRVVVAGGLPSSPRTQPSLEEERDQIIALLKQHDAIEDLQRSASITVGRLDIKHTVFEKDTNAFNRYTLFEAIAQDYMTAQNALAFPDFSRVKVKRLKGKTPNEELLLDLETVFKFGECAKDMWVEWGDLIEIPEQDHGVSQPWLGFSQDTRNALAKCLQKKMQVIVKGQTNVIVLETEFLRVPTALSGLHVPTLLPSSLSAVPATPAPETEITLSQDRTGGWLNGVIRAANVIRSSSDLTRVKVKRSDPITHEKRDMTFNLHRVDKRNDVWLRDGDVIEIPEKQ